MADPIKRFHQKILKTESCWLWMASLNGPNGYGQFWDGNRVITAHHFSYRTFNGRTFNRKGNKIHIHHICQNKICVNPKHLKQVRAIENVRFSSPQVKKKHCPKGHEYDLIEYRADRTFRCRRCSICRKKNK